MGPLRRTTVPLVVAMELQGQAGSPRAPLLKNTEHRGQRRVIMVHLLYRVKRLRSMVRLVRTTEHQGRVLEALEEDLEVLRKSMAPLERNTFHLRVAN